MTEDEQREALMRFAKSIGDAAAGIALGMVAIGAAFQECTKAFDGYAAATREGPQPDDADST